VFQGDWTAKKENKDKRGGRFKPGIDLRKEKSGQKGAEKKGWKPHVETGTFTHQRARKPKKKSMAQRAPRGPKRECWRKVEGRV